MAIFCLRVVGPCSNLDWVFPMLCPFRNMHFCTFFYKNGAKGSSQSGQKMSFRGQFSPHFWLQTCVILTVWAPIKSSVLLPSKHAFPLILGGFGHCHAHFFLEARGAHIPLRTPRLKGALPPLGTPWRHIFVGGGARKNTQFFKITFPKWKMSILGPGDRF